MTFQLPTIHSDVDVTSVGTAVLKGPIFFSIENTALPHQLNLGFSEIRQGGDLGDSIHPAEMQSLGLSPSCSAAAWMGGHGLQSHSGTKRLWLHP